MKTNELSLSTPTSDEIKKYNQTWSERIEYVAREKALFKLFNEIYPNNTDIYEILIKVAALNDFYSTNIFSVYSVAEHILSLKIDERLKSGDSTLVKEIAEITISSKSKNFYSFATKYCTHHNPEA